MAERIEAKAEIRKLLISERRKLLHPNYSLSYLPHLVPSYLSLKVCTAVTIVTTIRLGNKRCISYSSHLLNPSDFAKGLFRIQRVRFWFGMGCGHLVVSFIKTYIHCTICKSELSLVCF